MDQDQPPQLENADVSTAREERRADVQRRIDEVAGVLAETLLGMWRAKHRAERRGEPWPPPEPPKKPEPRNSVLSDEPKALRRAFRDLAPGDEPTANVLLQATWFPVLELWLEPAGGKRTRAVLEYGRVVMGVVVLDEYGDAAVLRALAVRSTHRRQGHGRSLVEFIVRHAYQAGVGRMYAASGTPWFAEEVGFEVRQRELLPEDARRLPGIIDAPRNAYVFELTPTMSGRRAPRRTGPRSASEALATGPRSPRRQPATAKRDVMGARPGGFAAERHQGTHVGPGRAEGAAPTLPARLGASGRPWRCSGAEAPHALASLVCLSVGLVNGHNAGAHAAQGELRLEQSSPRATRFDFEQKT